MDQIGLIVVAFLSLLIFLVLILQYELDLTLVVAALLSVSVTSIGLIIAILLESVLGFSIQQTVLGLGLLMFLIALTYEIVS